MNFSWTTRVTQKDNENANARPSRITTRTPLSSSIVPVRGGATAATAASKAKASDAKADLAAGKRKREALGEVTSLVTNNQGKSKAAAVKEKETGGLNGQCDGAVIKTKTTTTTTPLRQPPSF